MDYKSLVASIIKCLKQLLELDTLNEDSRESLEVSIECLESSYGVQASDALPNFDILELFKSKEATPEAKEEAERLKNEGNALIKNDKYQEALINYTKAIELDGNNAVYYCNRAAVHTKIGNHDQAIKDCKKALSIDPSYSKAYGRLGLAYSSINKFNEAKESYQKALELEPDNESHKNNLQIAEDKCKQQSTGLLGDVSGLPNMDFASLISNPALVNMATRMLSDPGMQNMMSSFIRRNDEQGGRMEAFMEAGQQLAQQIQNENPDLLNVFRQQLEGNANDPDPSKQKDL